VSAALVFPLALSAPRARVFAALTEARHLERWFCDHAASEPGLNGRLVLRWTRATSSPHAFEARWVEWDPPARAAFHGGHPGYPNGDAGIVTFTLEEDAAGTHLDVRHQVPDGPGHAPLAREWGAAWPRALARLAAYLAPLPARSD
jgi:uncharacterized protein YndB with AHSA1/START domain